MLRKLERWKSCLIVSNLCSSFSVSPNNEERCKDLHQRNLQILEEEGKLNVFGNHVSMGSSFLVAAKVKNAE
jgi:hypothetical protein